ncbi:MAG: glycosyltransferase [Syntrophorhabdales bacterium]|jgi:glycosyltransferase involved in cell wall biosynthesis
MRVRVVHVIWDLASTGGAEKLFLHFARNLDSRRFDTSFISLMGKGEIGNTLEALGFPVYALEVILKKAWNPWITLKLYQLFRKLNPDIVHVHLNYSGILAARMAKTSVLVNHIHNIYPGKSKVKIAMENILFRLPDVSIAVSSNAREFTWKQLRAPKLPIEVVRNGIDVVSLEVTKTKAEVRKELSIDDDEQIILTVGSLTDQKGQWHLISAYARLNLLLPRTRLVIVGKGPLEGSLRNQVLSLGLEDRILFTGLRNDVPNLLNSASMFVLPSLWEGIPLALLEAMYFRLPCIVSEVGGIGEIIENGMDGILVEPADETALCVSMESLVKNKLLRESLGEEANKKVRRCFTIDRTMKEIEHLYMKLLDNRKQLAEPVQ